MASSARAAAHEREGRGTPVFSVCLALFVAVAVARTHEIMPGLPYLRPGKLLILPILVAMAVALPRWQLLAALRTRVAKCVAVIGLLALLSSPLSIWPSNSLGYFVNALVPTLLLFVLASAGFADRPTARLCILSLVLSVGADALFVLAGPAPLKAGRPYIGVGLDPNESAALFVFTLPFAVALGTGREKRRWFGFAIAMLLVAGVVVTGSRGGVVGLLIVGMTLVLRAAPRRRPAYLAAIAIGASVFVLTADETQLTRFGTILTPRSDYNLTDREGRIQVWTRGIGYMITHPVLGTGLDSFETAEGVLGGKVNEGFGIRYTAAHNAFVQIGAELGVFALAAFLVAFWSAGSGCRRINRRAIQDHAAHPQLADREAKLAASAYSALLGLAVTGIFLSIAYHPVTLFALAVCVGVRIGSPYDVYDPATAPRPAGLGWAVRRRPVTGLAALESR
jgi:O-antigen ligase